MGGRDGVAGRIAAAPDRFDREIAVKVMSVGQDAGRFIVEAKVTGRLPHPGIPPVHALGTLPDGRPFLAMKLIRGRTLGALLEDRLKSGAPSTPELLGIFEHICQTVGFAEPAEIDALNIHRASLATMRRAFASELVLGFPAIAAPVFGSSRRIAPSRPVGSAGVRTSWLRSAPPSAVGGAS